jgi:hypothetical protein
MATSSVSITSALVMATVTSCSLVILTPQADCNDWITSIRTAARSQEIWDYVNPDTLEPPALTSPAKPTFQSVKARATTYLELDSGERDYYKLLLQQHFSELGNYKRLHSAVMWFSAHIQDSVANINTSYLCDCITPRDMLVKLKAAFAPSDQSRESDMLLHYRKLHKPPRTKNLDGWLHSWELTYADATSTSLPDVAGDRAVMDFLLAIKNIILAFDSY